MTSHAHGDLLCLRAATADTVPMLKSKEVTDMFDHDQIRLVNSLSKINCIAIDDRTTSTTTNPGLRLTLTLPPVPHRDVPSVTHQDASCCASPGPPSSSSLL